MSRVKRLLEIQKEELYLSHITFHRDAAGFPNLLCKLCEEEMELARQDHLRADELSAMEVLEDVDYSEDAQ